VAVEFVGVEERRWGSLYRALEAVGRCGLVERGGGGRRAPRAELMAGGHVGLSGSGVQRRGRRGRSLCHVEGEAGHCC